MRRTSRENRLGTGREPAHPSGHRSPLFSLKIAGLSELLRTEACEGEQQQLPFSTQQAIAQISGELAASAPCAQIQDATSAITAQAALILISLIALSLAIDSRMSDRAYFHRTAPSSCPTSCQLVGCAAGLTIPPEGSSTSWQLSGRSKNHVRSGSNIRLLLLQFCKRSQNLFAVIHDLHARVHLPNRALGVDYEGVPS